MQVQIHDTWTMVTIEGVKTLQLRSDGAIEALGQASEPIDSQIGLIFADGWTQTIEAAATVPITWWMRQMPNTSRAELVISEAYQALGLDSPSLGGNELTPSDTNDLPSSIRAVTIGTSPGRVRYTHALTDEICTTGPLPIGQHSIWASKVWFTGTTAIGLTGWK